MTPKCGIAPEWPLVEVQAQRYSLGRSLAPPYRARAYWPVSTEGGDRLYPMLEMFHGGAVTPCRSRVYFQKGESVLGTVWSLLSSGDEKKMPMLVTEPIKTINDCGGDAPWRAELAGDRTDKALERLGTHIALESGYSTQVARIACVAFNTAQGPVILSVETTHPDGFGKTHDTQYEFLQNRLLKVAGTRIDSGHSRSLRNMPYASCVPNITWIKRKQ